MRVVTITTFFPNAAERHRAVFVKNLVAAMKRRCRMAVIAPVPYIPPLPAKSKWQGHRSIPASDMVDGMSVDHPRFLVLPKLGWFSGFGYFLGILRLVRRLKRGEDPVILHAHCAYPDAVGVALAARLLKLPYVVTAHGSDINVYAERLALRFQIRWALWHADGVIAVSRALESRIGRLLGAARTKVAYIPCAAFDPQVFFPRSRHDTRSMLNIDPKARVVVFVGQLVPIKGVEFLMDAWAELLGRGSLAPVDRLVLLGDGPSRDDLQRQMADKHLSGTVHFAGAVNQAEVARWISAANLLCLPSRNEGTPNVIIEALASGIPVVASNVGGIPDLIREGENGFLVPPAEVSLLADALHRTLERNWNAQAIHDSVADRTWQTIADRNCDYLQSIIDHHDILA